MTFHPQNPYIYKAKVEVTSAQWTGHNLEDFRELLYDIVDHDIDGIPSVYSDEIEPYFIHYGGKAHARAGYNILKFYAGDDMEVDPGQWVVVYEDGEVEIMDNEQFQKMFY